MNLPKPADSWMGRQLGVELRWSRLPDEIADSDLDVLSTGERRRAETFAAPGRRLEYVASRAFLRRALADVLNVAPSSLPIDADDFGKPQHAGGVQFNLSHSAHAVLIGWGNAPLGVDLESLRRRVRSIGRLQIVAQVCDVMSIDPIAAFTLVEAATKAIGHGLAAIKDLRLDDVGDAGEIQFSSSRSGRLIQAAAVPVPGDYVGAVAVVG